MRGQLSCQPCAPHKRQSERIALKVMSVFSSTACPRDRLRIREAHCHPVIKTVIKKHERFQTLDIQLRNDRFSDGLSLSDDKAFIVSVWKTTEADKNINNP